MMRAAYGAAVAVFAHVLVGCSSEPHSDAAAYAAPPAEIGFLELEGEQYSLGGTMLTSSRARIFYDFQPAENATQQTPIFVLGGGGPGASAMFLLAYEGPNTTVETDASGVASTPNASRLTDLGHLLYFDARNAGFSYPLIADPADRTKRQGDLGAQNYNVYRDAADEWRALLAFWDLHPELAHNPVYFLAESYGGMRATVMLNMLFSRADYASGARTFAAPDLMQRLACPGSPGSAAPLPCEADVSKQFRGQILLEPLLAGMRQDDIAAQLFEQPGSILDQLAAETGVPYARCGSGCTAFGNVQLFLMTIDRSLYDYRASSAWLDRIIETVSNAATHREMLARLTGVENAAVDRVIGGARAGAYRFGDPNNALFCPRGDLEQTYGALPAWDAHFVAFNAEAMGAFVGGASKALLADTSQAGFGDLFIENLRHVPTFVSRATFDLAIYGPALVPVLQSYPAVRRAAIDATGREIEVELGDGTVRRIFSPEYASSHLIQHDRPAELHADIAAFLTRTAQSR
jgi:pimeloyl-ACP methyl ester carboxylesterase